MPILTGEAITAAHELGHAYLAKHAGLSIRYIEIQRTGELVCGQTNVDFGDRIISEEQAIGQLIMYMAGQQAAEVFMLEQGLPWQFNAQDDYAQFDAAREHYLGEWKPGGRWLPTQPEAEEQARTLVRSYWGRIMERVPILAGTGSISPGEL